MFAGTRLPPNEEAINRTIIIELMKSQRVDKQRFDAFWRSLPDLSFTAVEILSKIYPDEIVEEYEKIGAELFYYQQENDLPVNGGRGDDSVKLLCACDRLLAKYGFVKDNLDFGFWIGETQKTAVMAVDEGAGKRIMDLVLVLANRQSYSVNYLKFIHIKECKLSGKLHIFISLKDNVIAYEIAMLYNQMYKDSEINLATVKDILINHPNKVKDTSNRRQFPCYPYTVYNDENMISDDCTAYEGRGDKVINWKRYGNDALNAWEREIRSAIKYVIDIPPDTDNQFVPFEKQF
jgi:hypothetical protein